ncbi:calcium/calmodulin-dependent protein kinase type IV-like [Venturia canescens]|uniref:calcium/calmodulin-dependent protein kinase type IV-like n=1 Tax=Venturia canescens TaxID=32260 RepID=UPI001C9CF4D9|nr:calcium/calmodulin-dependent protein kinase type IV-like [Venturia canescens]XP_043277406.1 calcium/calmodulin-dependent protein kinase type IV-like [Venturia canescens]XP_043277407.1 calcium/calmodulin-dependent protein kinase type IV-like [Venturia canescens]XP_043277408.1 calcium/calmodulin-dependent protein kinase type IV-like [Venturia canescens]
MENENDWLVHVTKGSFHNEYILGDIIGRGLTSTVHSCLHKGRKKYACKIMPKTRLKEADTSRKLQALLKLRHDNIVSVKEVYEDDLRIFVIEDLAAGGELLERLASRGGYSERDAANAVRDAAAALEYVHSMGLCHGNLRPEKLLYANENEDSRLLLAGSETTNRSLNSYKMLYCAPEVISTGEAAPSSDIWSLGIVLYIMLCGFEPFRKAAEMFPSPYWDDKTEESKRLVTQLMRQSPNERPTAADLLTNSWIRGEKTAKHSMHEVAQHLREFNARRKFKAATHAVRATHRAIAMTQCHGAVIG